MLLAAFSPDAGAANLNGDIVAVDFARASLLIVTDRRRHHPAVDTTTAIGTGEEFDPIHA